MAALQSSIRAECQGTYRSWVDPASRTCLKACKLDLIDSWYMKVFLISVASLRASWCKDPDFFHFCMNHIPETLKIPLKWVSFIFGLPLYRVTLVLSDFYVEWAFIVNYLYIEWPLYWKTFILSDLYSELPLYWKTFILSDLYIERPLYWVIFILKDLCIEWHFIVNCLYSELPL